MKQFGFLTFLYVVSNSRFSKNCSITKVCILGIVNKQPKNFDPIKMFQTIFFSSFGVVYAPVTDCKNCKLAFPACNPNGASFIRGEYIIGCLQ